jgi:nitrite reductase (NADH) small subunit
MTPPEAQEAGTTTFEPAHESREPVASHAEWLDACALDDVPPGTGVAALVRGEQVAIVRAQDGEVFGLSNFDPFSKAFVIARGIVGDRDGVRKIASPIYKQNFCLATGQCLDDRSVRLPTFRLRVVAGRILIDLADIGRTR